MRFTDNRLHAWRSGLLVGAAALAAAGPSLAQDAPPSRPDGAARTGLLRNADGALPGYTLFAPLDATTTYLVDMRGEVVHKWESQYPPGQSVYLLDDGTLLRAAQEPDNRHFAGGGIGGRVQRLAPDGTVLWDYVCADAQRCLHHDVEPLPNGNVLVIAWEKKTRAEALAAGRDPELQEGDELWPDCVLEIEPQGTSGGRIVWEWHVWDHLVQEFDAGKPNYGVVAEHPERIDLNYRRTAPRETLEEIRRLRAIGYIGGGAPDEADDARPDGGASEDGERGEDGRQRGRRSGPGGRGMRADMCHTNAIDYNAQLDQIVLSVHTFNEIWVIDHSTTTEEARGSRGGRAGRGGDLLYRWGNPRAHGAGDAGDQKLFAQHDAQWIPEGLPGAGNLLVFNNGRGRDDGEYSTVVEITPPVEPGGTYARTRPAFGPSRFAWEYMAEKETDFYSGHISGAQRLANGNTLICSGEQGRVFEVTRAGDTVWEYVNPFRSNRPPRDGFLPRGGPGGPEGPDGPRWRPAGPSSGERPRFGPPPGERGGRGGPGGPGGLFRATRIAAEHPGSQKLLATRTEP